MHVRVCARVLEKRAGKSHCKIRTLYFFLTAIKKSFRDYIYFLEENCYSLLTCSLLYLQNSTCQAEGSRLQQALCFSIYQGFVFAYESMLASQVRLLL